jgi:hypothetical protein
MNYLYWLVLKGQQTMTSEQRKNKRRQEWRHFTRKYWKLRAKEITSSITFSPENINRMKLGKAPRRFALVRHIETGRCIEAHLPLELHHVFGMNPATPQDEQTVLELWPHQHSLCDEHRKVNFEFIEWRGKL